MHNKSKMILKQKIAEDVQENKEGRTKEVSELHLWFDWFDCSKILYL